MPPELNIEDVINIDDYPVHDRNHPARAELIASCRADLEKNMFCAIPNFVRPSALQAMAEEAGQLRPGAYDNNSRRNVYLQRQLDPSLPEDHARNHLNSTSTRMIAYDQIGDLSPLKVFYHSDAVREMIADIVGSEQLFDNEDPYQPANYVCYDDGDQSSWHFDSDNSFTVTLMVQAADSGGEFQMSANARTDTDQNYDHVARILRGERNDTIASVGREPGALCIFRGCNCLHRVSPVKGATMRIMGVFVYEREPGILGDQEVNETIYGSRVATAG
jgi:hypothetical protein